MKLSRRGLFAGVLGLPLVALLGKAEPEPAFVPSTKPLFDLINTSNTLTTIAHSSYGTATLTIYELSGGYKVYQPPADVFLGKRSTTRRLELK